MLYHAVSSNIRTSAAPALIHVHILCAVVVGSLLFGGAAGAKEVKGAGGAGAGGAKDVKEEIEVVSDEEILERGWCVNQMLDMRTIQDVSWYAHEYSDDDDSEADDLVSKIVRYSFSVMHGERQSAMLAAHVLAILVREKLGYNTSLIMMQNTKHMIDTLRRCDLSAPPGSTDGPVQCGVALVPATRSTEALHAGQRVASLNSVGFLSRLGLHFPAYINEKAAIRGLRLSLWESLRDTMVQKLFPTLGEMNGELDKLGLPSVDRCPLLLDLQQEALDEHGLRCERGWFSSMRCGPDIMGSPRCIPVLFHEFSDDLVRWAVLAKSTRTPLAFKWFSNSTEYKEVLKALDAQQIGMLFNWWSPDKSLDFADDPMLVWSTDGGTNSLLTSQIQSTEKLIWTELSQAAPDIFFILLRFHLEDEDIEQLFDAFVGRQQNGQVAPGRAAYLAACEWVAKHFDTYEPWLPDESLCEPGYYSEGRVCTPCPRDHYSLRRGAKQCAECEPGTVQPQRGELQCLACPRGKYWVAHQEEGGVALFDCHECPEGYHQPEKGALSCLPCPLDASLYNLVHYAKQGSITCEIHDDYFRQCAAVACSTFLAVWIARGLVQHRLRIAEARGHKDKLIVTVMTDFSLAWLWFDKRCTPELQVTLVETQNRLIDGKTYRATVVGNDRLQLYPPAGSSFDSTMETSRGVLCIAPWWKVYNLIAFVVCSAFSIGLALAGLRSESAAAAILLGAVFGLIVSLTRHHLYWSQTRHVSPVHERVVTYLQTLPEKPKPCRRGPERGITAGQLDEFYSFFQDFICDRNMYYMDANIISPMTARSKLSFAEVIGPSPLRFFCSHYWGSPFCDFVDSVQEHAKAAEEDNHDEDRWRTVSYWVCSFANNQWEIATEIGQDWTESSFYHAISAPICQGTCIILDKEVTPLTRSWCLFELFQTLQRAAKGSFDLSLCTPTGVLESGDASLDITVNLAKELMHLDLEAAQATMPRDKEMIDKLVLEQLGSFSEMHSFVRAELLRVLQAANKTVDMQFGRLFSALALLQRPEEVGQKAAQECAQVAFSYHDKRDLGYLELDHLERMMEWFGFEPGAAEMVMTQCSPDGNGRLQMDHFMEVLRCVRDMHANKLMTGEQDLCLEDNRKRTAMRFITGTLSHMSLSCSSRTTTDVMQVALRKLNKDTGGVVTPLHHNHGILHDFGLQNPLVVDVGDYLQAGAAATLAVAARGSDTVVRSAKQLATIDFDFPLRRPVISPDDDSNAGCTSQPLASKPETIGAHMVSL
eukprot:TRINITY_DN1958_c0_g2_i1.p1 TRINITY_DN1958_c0_g2~~TRINITY_DN1958_c0_g2_i1.p1  ORF type:complete len:1271 (+),score=227.82 TRINITY_DN1958_c0_g2_i1:107-3919(+)